MYFQLTSALKRRFIEELRRYWAAHPRYRDDLVNNIQGKFSFDERPQYGIIVKTSGATKVDLSPSNFLGTLSSYVYLAEVGNYPGLSIEWVREDSVAIQNNGGIFPSAPGVYYIQLTQEDEFYVHPLLDVRDEAATQISVKAVQLQHGYIQGSLRLFSQPSAYLLQDGVEYVGDPATGEITLTYPLAQNTFLVADYRYEGTTTGPYKIIQNRANHTAIPGAVLAFGRRNQAGDRLAVVVQPTRSPAAQVYGGRWELGLDFEVIARDVFAQQELADYSLIYLWGIARPRLSTEGIEVTDVSLGGESEEMYDETGEEFYYNSSFTMSVQTEWEVHVPIYGEIRRVSDLTSAQQQELSGLSPEEIGAVTSNIRMLESLGMTSFRDPFFSGRNRNFELIR